MPERNFRNAHCPAQQGISFSEIDVIVESRSQRDEIKNRNTLRVLDHQTSDCVIHSSKQAELDVLNTQQILNYEFLALPLIPSSFAILQPTYQKCIETPKGLAPLIVPDI